LIHAPPVAMQSEARVILAFCAAGLRQIFPAGFACAPPLEDNAAHRALRMPTPAQLFRLLNEMVFVLLGGLLLLMAVSGYFAVPGRSMAWLVLGAVLIYWGLRAWVRPDRGAARWQAGLRGGSLMLVGALVLGIAWLPFRYSAALLGAAGAVLVLRGLANALFFARGS
jgi:hypothetical protein